MKKKTLSYIILFIVCIGAIGVGAEIIMSETLYPEIDEFSGCPIWYQILMYFFLILILIGLILSTLFRNKSNTTTKELIIEGFFAFLGIIGFSFGLLRVRQEYEDIVICIGGFLFCIGFFPCISSIIGLSRNDKKTQKTIVVPSVKRQKRESRPGKITNKTVMILSIVTVVGSIMIFVGGILTDIIFWTNAYNHRDPNTPGHGVPVFSVFGIALSLVFAIIMGIIIGVITIKNNRK